MHKIIFLVCCLIFSSGAFSKELKIATGEYPPFTGKDLPKNGCALNIIRQAFEEEGYVVKYKFLPWKRAYVEAKKGKFDASAIWMDRADRRKDFVFPESNITEDIYVFISLKKDEFDWDSFESLASKKIIVNRGYTYDEAFWDGIKEYAKGIVTANKENESINLLLKGRGDVAIISKKVYLSLKTTHKRKSEFNKLAVHPKKPVETKGYLVFSRKDGAEKLAKIYDQGFKKVIKLEKLKKARKTCLNID